MFACCCTSQPSRAEEVKLVLVTSYTVDKEEPEEIPNEEQEEPTTPSELFEVTVPGGSWVGLADMWDDCIHVKKVEGSFRKYNDSASEAKKIRENDFILQINGEPVVKYKVHSQKASTEPLRLKIERPVPLVVKLTIKPGQKWNVKCAYQPKGNLIRVKEVNASSEQVDEGATLNVKDFIKQVNGCAGAPDEMLKFLQTAEELELSILRLSTSGLERRSLSFLTSLLSFIF
jgi:hypothetical protein